MTLFDIIWSVSILLLKGQVLHVDGVTAASGTVVQGRAILIRDTCAFNAARVFVDAVGPGRALKSARVRACLPKKGVVQWL